MKILIACEESQEVCKTFRAKGHEAYSCDILPCSGGHPEWHLHGSVSDHFYPKDQWDLVIAHPPCTYLSNSGVRWLYPRENNDRWRLMREASDFFNFFVNIHYFSGGKTKVAIENPIQHKHCALPKHTQIIQPWQFGHGETKATCLWLYGLPELVPTNIVEGREQRIWKMPPSADRAKLRSKTYRGIAVAMADQWG